MQPDGLHGRTSGTRNNRSQRNDANSQHAQAIAHSKASIKGRGRLPDSCAGTQEQGECRLRPRSRPPNATGADLQFESKPFTGIHTLFSLETFDDDVSNISGQSGLQALCLRRRQPVPLQRKRLPVDTTLPDGIGAGDSPGSSPPCFRPFSCSPFGREFGPSLEIPFFRISPKQPAARSPPRDITPHTSLPGAFSRESTSVTSSSGSSRFRS